MTDFSLYENFTEDEFRCKCGCGRADMDPLFLRELQALRKRFGFPMVVTSGFRCPEPNAAVSSTGLAGPHTTGRAADFRVDRQRAWWLNKCLNGCFSGIGYQQKGGGRFMHLDTLSAMQAPRPNLWTY